MRYGFFHGIEGNAAALATALELLGGCDRIVCLGGLVGAPAPGDAAVLAQLDNAICLLGPGERQRVRDASLPTELRARLRALPEATVEGGIAVFGQPRRAAASRTADGEPRLVAPLAVAAGRGATRLWRAAGGLCRVEELGGAACVGIGGERLRLDLAPALGADGIVRVAVIDRQTGKLELRERAIGASASPGAPGMQDGDATPAQIQVKARRPAARRRRVDAGQQLLAV